MEIISVKNLVKEFSARDGSAFGGNSIRAVDNISFKVDAGEIFAFLGPNGAGKNTTIRILTTLLHPTGGSVLINGYDPVKDPKDVRRSFGIVFQDPSLDDELTAYENMEFHGVLYGMPKKLRHDRIEQLMKLADLWDRKNDLVKHYSGGMRRRLEIARGILHHPKILFLDEPTLGLDPQTRDHLWNHIKNLNKNENVTIFFTTHYMEEADRVAGRVAVVDNGKIIGEGSPQELKNKTNSATLEEAFLSLTGREIRDEKSKNIDELRIRHRAWTGRR